MRTLPNKLFFKIGEVAEIVGVKAHVLRYWESEFTSLRPMKTRGAHRVYRRKDVETATIIRRLLQDEGLTISGAKRRLREIGSEQNASTPDATSLGWRADLIAVRHELEQLLETIDTNRVPSPSHRHVDSSSYISSDNIVVNHVSSSAVRPTQQHS